jgi:LAS superfamily LD-carboxypeptidase LdcB
MSYMFLDLATQKTSNTTTLSPRDTRTIAWTNRINGIKLSMQEHINMDDDASLYVFVSAKKPLRNPDYIPAQLVLIDSPYIIQNGPGMQLRPEANAAFHDLAEAFYNIFNKKLYLVSAYRSHKLQQQLLDNGCPRSRCATPGTSEHQL